MTKAVQFIEDMVRAIIAGEALEVSALRRSTVRVTMPDGGVIEETGHDPPGLLMWLQGWYTAMCDGDWEHEHGISIETLDIPGWRDGLP